MFLRSSKSVTRVGLDPKLGALSGRRCGDGGGRRPASYVILHDVGRINLEVKLNFVKSFLGS